MTDQSEMTPITSAARPWVPFRDRYGYRTHLDGLGRIFFSCRHTHDDNDAAGWSHCERDPRFRCACPGSPGHPRCCQRASQEDRLCDACRDWCVAVDEARGLSPVHRPLRSRIMTNDPVTTSAAVHPLHMPRPGRCHNAYCDELTTHVVRYRRLKGGWATGIDYCEQHAHEAAQRMRETFKVVVEPR